MCSLESVCAVLESRMLKTLAQSPKTGPILVDCMRNLWTLPVRHARATATEWRRMSGRGVARLWCLLATSSLLLISFAASTVQPDSTATFISSQH